MTLTVGTDSGAWSVSGERAELIGLDGKGISHVAVRDGTVLAAVPRDGLYSVSGDLERSIWQGDARACGIAPDGSIYVGTEPAMIFRSDDFGDSWDRLDAIDRLPTRSDWYFPPPPHEPHVRSIDFLPDDPASIIAGVEVGGVLVSHDRGESWREMNSGINVDVHTVRPDPSQHGHLLAVTGGGFYASENGGTTWERRMSGVDRGYTAGLHVNPERASEVLIVAGDRPPGRNGRVYHSLDAGVNWTRIDDPALPERYDRVPVVLFAESAAWLATDDGDVYRAESPSDTWSFVCRLSAPANAMVADGSPSSITSGF